jgi:hypothetical protein
MPGKHPTIATDRNVYSYARNSSPPAKSSANRHCWRRAIAHLRLSRPDKVNSSTQRSLTAATQVRRFEHRRRTASRRGCGRWVFYWILCRLPGAFRPRINMAPLRRFPACSGTRKCKRRCTRISRDAHRWHACAGIGSCPPAAHTHQVGDGTPGRETAPPSSRGARHIWRRKF